VPSGGAVTGTTSRRGERDALGFFDPAAVEKVLPDLEAVGMAGGSAPKAGRDPCALAHAAALITTTTHSFTSHAVQPLAGGRDRSQQPFQALCGGQGA
jgi:hypothetical protein